MEDKAKVTEMQGSDIPQVAEVLGRAYATNPTMLATYRGKQMLATRIQITFGAMFRYQPGECFVSELDGQIVGGMRITKWPDCQGMSVKATPSVLRAAGGLGPIMRAMKHIVAWKKHDTK